MKKIGFLSFGHWTPEPYSDVRTASNALLQSIELAVAAEELSLDGAYFRVHHFARQLGSPFPLLAAVGAQVGSGLLARYIGRYAFRDGSRTVAGFMGMNQNVTLVNDRLYLNALPLIPLSETTFESTGAIAEFFVDASGQATRLVLGQTEGEATYDLKR